MMKWQVTISINWAQHLQTAANKRVPTIEPAYSQSTFVYTPNAITRQEHMRSLQLPTSNNFQRDVLMKASEGIITP